MRILLLLFCLLPVRSEEWIDVLAKTPFPKTSFRAYQTEPVKLLLKSFRPSTEMRALVLMPAASDQLYFFDWEKIELPKKPTLLDALNALTNRADLRYTFAAPFLLVHLARDTTSDPLSMDADVSDELGRRKKSRIYYLDRPYDRILPELRKLTGLPSFPDQSDSASWHFYRLSFIGRDLSATDVLRAMAYGTKTSVHVEADRIVFKDRPYQLPSGSPTR